MILLHLSLLLRVVIGYHDAVIVVVIVKKVEFVRAKSLGGNAIIAKVAIDTSTFNRLISRK